MGWVLLGILVTYVVAPLASYALIAPAYRLKDDAPFRTLVIAMGFGPIGISLLLFFLFTIFPGRSDRFYVSVVVFSLLLALVLGYRSLAKLLGSGTWRIPFPRKSVIPVIFRSAISILAMSLGLVLFAYFIYDLRHLVIFYIAVIFAVGLVPLALVPLVREAQNLIALTLGRFARLSSKFSRLSDDYLVVAFGVALTVIVLAMVLYAGLAAPLTASDPIKYAMVSRAIYYAKSLAIYPILTGLPDSGLIERSSHPPAFPMLHVWGYFFDGPEATRMLRLSPLFYLANMVLLMWALLRRYSTLAPILGGLFIVSIPFLIETAVISHIDLMRIYFFFLALALVADIITHSSLPRLVVCGVAIGFALYSHSLGALSALISGSAYLLLANNPLRDRLVNGAVVGLTGIAIGGTQYVKNLIQFKVPLLEYQPIWLIPGLHEFTDLAYRRGLGTPSDVLVNGILGNFTQGQIFGPICLLALILIMFRVRFLWRDVLTRVMLFAFIFFYIFVGALTLFHSLSAVKNIRYMMTITPVLCLLAAVVLGDLLSRRVQIKDVKERPSHVFNEKKERDIAKSYSLLTQGVALILMVLLTTYTTGLIRNRLPYSRVSLVWEGRDAEYVRDSGFVYGPLMRYFFNRPRSDGKVLAFRQAEFSFYAHYPWVDYYDPSLIDFYKAGDKESALRELRQLGISYFLVPAGLSIPTAYYNSQAIEIAADPQLAEIVAASAGGAIFRLRTSPEPVLRKSVVPSTGLLEYELPPDNWYRVNYLASLLPLSITKPEGPVERRKISFDQTDLTAGSLARKIEMTGLAYVEFGGIDISSDAQSRESRDGARRLHVAVDLQGEGLGYIYAQYFLNDGTRTDSDLWSGVLLDKVRRVNVQTVIPPNATQLHLIIRKYQSRIGSLNVHALKLYTFNGPRTIEAN